MATPGPGAEAQTQVVNDLAGIAQILLAEGTVSEVLQRIVTLAVETIDPCEVAGVCDHAFDQGIAVRTALAGVLDALQSALGEGPCLDALAGEQTVYSSDLAQEPRWPHFAPQAVEQGVRCVVAYRLATTTETLGALQLYATVPAAFDLEERAQGLIFASYAGLALEVAHRTADERLRVENLRAALASREIIGQAQGILMERERVTADQAFELLRKASQRLNLKLRDVAQELVDTGSVPGDEAPPATPERPSAPSG